VRTNMSGHDLYLEGMALAPSLYPEPCKRAAARFRLLKRLRPLMNSGNPKYQAIGFFLFGVAEGLKAVRHG
jgi:hypothetical protein